MTIEDKINNILGAMSDDVYIKHDEFSVLAFKDGYDQGYNDAIDKACEWMSFHGGEYIRHYMCTDYVDLDEMVKDFRIEMEK